MSLTGGEVGAQGTDDCGAELAGDAGQSVPKVAA